MRGPFQIGGAKQRSFSICQDLLNGETGAIFRLRGVGDCGKIKYSGLPALLRAILGPSIREKMQHSRRML
jgi:hypothetical protein